jgi:hypothetical protein
MNFQLKQQNSFRVKEGLTDINKLVDEIQNENQVVFDNVFDLIQFLFQRKNIETEKIVEVEKIVEIEVQVERQFDDNDVFFKLSEDEQLVFQHISSSRSEKLGLPSYTNSKLAREMCFNKGTLYNYGGAFYTGL